MHSIKSLVDNNKKEVFELVRAPPRFNSRIEVKEEYLNKNNNVNYSRQQEDVALRLRSAVEPESNL